VTVGDLVRKKSGGSKGDIGIIIDISTNPPAGPEKDPVTILTVISDGAMKNWYSKFVEVVNERK
tara:strand:- start:96 stop:287 length:192 start_codon:yes stop_codon:yes gene_type:complete